MGCIHEFYLVVSTGPNRTGAVVWSLRRKLTRCGCFFARGTYPTSGEFAWQRWIATAAIFIRKLQHWIGCWMLWGLTFRWRQSAVARPFLLKPSVNIWAVGSVRNSLTTQFSIFGCLDGACSGHLPVCSGVWTGSQWPNSLWICWKLLRRVIGCPLAPLWEKPSWPTTWVCHILSTLSPISSAFGPWLSPTWRRRDAKTMGIVLW